MRDGNSRASQDIIILSVTEKTAKFIKYILFEAVFIKIFCLKIRHDNFPIPKGRGQAPMSSPLWVCHWMSLISFYLYCKHNQTNLVFQSHTSNGENGMKSLDMLHRKTDLLESNQTNKKNSGQAITHAETHTSADSSEDISALQPPPQEFFMRIRGMISAAKNRLNSFRYKPTLLVIPEDDYFYQDFKEKDMEASGKKNSYRKFCKKGGNIPTSSKVESIHGSNLGAAMLEAKLAAPQPPPRNAKPKSKKRAPSPPGEIPLPDYPREGSSPASLREYEGSSERRSNRRRSPTPNAENYSKFDKFRYDLYQKIHLMREGSSAVENEIVLEYSENKRPSEKGNIYFYFSFILRKHIVIIIAFLCSINGNAR